MASISGLEYFSTDWQVTKKLQGVKILHLHKKCQTYKPSNTEYDIGYEDLMLVSVTDSLQIWHSVL